MTNSAVSSISTQSSQWVGEWSSTYTGVWIDYALLLVKYLSLYSKTVFLMIATTCFLLLFQSALLIHSGKEVTEKVLFSRINQGGSRTKQLLCPRPFSARHRLHGFSRLASVAWFPALGTGCMVSRAWHRLHGFLHLASVFFICLISQALRRKLCY